MTSLIIAFVQFLQTEPFFSSYILNLEKQRLMNLSFFKKKQEIITQMVNAIIQNSILITYVQKTEIKSIQSKNTEIKSIKSKNNALKKLHRRWKLFGFYRELRIERTVGGLRSSRLGFMLRGSSSLLF